MLRLAFENCEMGGDLNLYTADPSSGASVKPGRKVRREPSNN